MPPSLVRARTTLILVVGASFVGCGSTGPEEPEPNAGLLGTWDLVITVPPDGPVSNRVTFSGSEASGTFLDQNGHGGPWSQTPDSVFWSYTNVPDLTNEFRGAMTSSARMAGVNGGRWQGRDFEGSWTGEKR